MRYTLFLLLLLLISCDNKENKKGRFLLKGNDKLQEGDITDEDRFEQVVRENGTDMLRVIAMALMNIIPTTTTVFGASYATSKAYGLGFSPTTYLWSSVVGNLVAVLLIPVVGDLSDLQQTRELLVSP
jgi:hypothetical protein